MSVLVENKIIISIILKLAPYPEVCSGKLGLL